MNDANYFTRDIRNKMNLIFKGVWKSHKILKFLICITAILRSEICQIRCCSNLLEICHASKTSWEIHQVSCGKNK